MAGLVPAISLRLALPCHPKRDARVKPAHDKAKRAGNPQAFLHDKAERNGDGAVHLPVHHRSSRRTIVGERERPPWGHVSIHGACPFGYHVVIGQAAAGILPKALLARADEAIDDDCLCRLM